MQKILEKLWGLLDLLKAQTLPINKITKVIIIDEYYNFMLITFLVILIFLKNFNISQEFIIIFFVTSFYINDFT